MGAESAARTRQTSTEAPAEAAIAAAPGLHVQRVLALQCAAGNRAVVEALRQTSPLRVQRQVLDPQRNQLDLPGVMSWLEANPPPGLASMLRNNKALLRKAVKQLVDDGDEHTLADLTSMHWSETGGLAFKGDASTLDFSALKAKNKKEVEKKIKAATGSGFDSALMAAGDLGEDEMIVTLAQGEPRAHPGPAGNPARRRENLDNLLKNAPKVTIAKGTWLMHMTKEMPTSDWLRKGWIGGNSPDAYSFFTLYRRGPAGAHANAFGGMLIYSLHRDVHAFFIEDYSAIVRQNYETMVGEDTDSPTRTPGMVDKGGGMADAFVSHLPEDKRPLAFVSPSEDELVFLNSRIPSIMSKEGLVTTNPEKKKQQEAQDAANGGLGPRPTDARAITDPETRKFEKFYY